MLKKIQDADTNIHHSDLYAAADRASIEADKKNQDYDTLKSKVDLAVKPKIEDIQQLRIQASTAALKTEAADERIDGEGSRKDRELKRHRRDADFDIDIGEAEANHDESKADKLRKKKKWLNKYDELLDIGEPEWQAKRGANLSYLGNGNAGHNALFAGADTGKGAVENLASARDAAHASSSPQNSSEMVTLVKGIATAIQELTNKWASTPVKVEARFS